MAHTTSIIVMTLGTGEVILVVVVVMVMFLVGMQSRRQQRRSSYAESHCVD
jgi:preprotein translocase subunit YajC